MSDAPQDGGGRFPRRLLYILGYMAFIYCLILALMRYAQHAAGY